MTLTAADADGIQALDVNQFTRFTDGFFVRLDVGNSCAPSVGSGMSINIDSGEVVYDGTSTSVSSQTVTLSTGSSQPRKDVIYIDSSGTAQVVEGTPDSPEPSGEVREATARPAPPDLEGVNSVVIAEVWVGASVTDLVTDDLRDRRVGFEESSLELQDLSGLVDTSNIADESIVESKLDVLDSPNDGDALAFNASQGRFEWVSVSGSPGGSDTEIQYNNGGSFGGITGTTFDDGNSEFSALSDINAVINALQGISFPNITGTPTFATHDHSEGGLSQIVNGGLAAAAVTTSKIDGSEGTSGQILETDGTQSGVTWADPGTDATTQADSVTKNGDGTTKVFLLPHSLGTTPAAASVHPTSEDCSTDFWITSKSSSNVEVTYAAAPPSGTNNLTWDVLTNDGTGTGETAADTATKSGDGSTTTFLLGHSLGGVPTAAQVHETSEDASADFWITNKTSTDVEITYDTAPSSGTSNLTYDIITR